MKEIQSNVTLRVEETEDPEKFKVSGRGDVMISNGSGPTPAYAQFSLQERGRLFVSPGDELCEVTPLSIRLRKKHLTENARVQAGRGKRT